MGHALIWLETLAGELLLVALVTAGAARLSRRGGQVVPPVLTVVLLLAAAGSLTWALGFLWRRGALGPYQFDYALSWTVALALGSGVLLVRGLRRAGDDEVSAARDWPAGRLAVALAVVAVLDAMTLSNLDLAMKVQLAAVRAESGARILALTPSRAADGDNAAPLYREAFQALTPRDQLPTPWKEKARAWLDPNARIDVGDKDLVEFVRSLEPGLALLHQAAARPGCTFERDYFQSGDLLLPELEHLQYGAELLAFDARVRAGHREVGHALADVAAIFGIARHANEPLLICFVVAARLDRLGVSTLEDVLARGRPGRDDLARLVLADVSYRAAVQRAIQVEEAALGLPVILAAASTPEGPGVRWLPEELSSLARAFFDTPFYRVFFLPDDLAAYRGHMKAFLDLAGRPYAEARAGWEELDRSILARRGGILAGLLLPNVAKCAGLAARTEALHRLAQLGLAAEAFRVKHGQLPAQADDLAPAFIARVPTDPFDGKPLRVKAEGKDLVLYSVGADGTDDRGTTWDDAVRQGDLVFRVRGR